MRARVFAAAGASAALVVGLLTGTATAQPSLEDQIRGLEVAAEQTGGYPGRDGLNINYDRDAVVDRNQSTFDDCDGIYSRYDATCHNSEDGVQIDHLVAVKEAWDSGLRGDGAWEEFDGDMANFAAMTSELNQSKSDQDIAEWTPPHGPSTCHFVESYVGTKVEYDLTVDQAEKSALLDHADNCDGGGNGGNGGNGGEGDDKDDKSEEPDKAPQPEPVEGDLEVTG